MVKSEQYDEKQELVEMETLLSPTSFQSESFFFPGEEMRSEPDHVLKRKVKSTPVPKLQVAFWMIYRSTYPLFFGVVIPYINSMLVEDIKVSDEAHVGHFSGIVESASAIGNSIGVFFWSSMSDKYGRKPTAIIGVGLSCLSCAGFGFSRSFAMLVFLRLAMGLTAGAQAATVKVMIAEEADATNNAKCFAFVGLGWQLGNTLTPMIGAALAKPALSWPSLFEGSIFERFPYALPGIAVSAVPFLATIAWIKYLKETHPEYSGERPALKAKRSDYIPVGEVDSCDPTPVSARFGTSIGTPEPTYFSSGFAFIMLLWYLIIFQVVALSASEILLFFSSTSIGGLGLTQKQMSLFLGLRPFLLCLYEFHVFPKLAKRYGPERVLKFLIWFPPVINTIYLVLSTAASTGMMNQTLMIFLLGLSLILQVIQNPVFLSGDVIIPARAPTKAKLSPANAISELVAQVAVGTGAFIGSSLFEASVTMSGEHAFWRGRLVWVILIAFSTWTAVISQWLTKMDGWREKEAQEEDP